MSARASPLEKCAELGDAETCIPGDASHGDRMDGIVPRDRDKASSVGHHDMLPFAKYLEAGLL